MPDTLVRSDPVPTVPFAAQGVTISLAPPMARFSLRARQPQALETVLNIKAPKNIGETQNGVACLGPDEWLLRAAEGTRLATGNGLPVAITDISERAICLVVEGPRATEVLMSGCPLNLSGFGVGRATRTIYETVEIILIREAEDRFHVEVWHSFAPWLWTALTTAAKH
jgi:sarcosine oxidase, subunit gamma